MDDIQSRKVRMLLLEIYYESNSHITKIIFKEQRIKFMSKFGIQDHMWDYDKLIYYTMNMKYKINITFMF